MAFEIIVAMLRDREPKDPLCIWNKETSETWNASETWKAFGVKGRDNIENLYYGLQSMLRTHFKKIDKKSFSRKNR